ncbi:hypothetical protein IPN41_03515 [Candidatus Falkowbacteria bacterium]|nr:MAG: hypothetical protein IPN41_03515 [Candidatus Falkowbacteria bacterium]
MSVILFSLLFSLNITLVPTVKADCFTIDSQMNCSSLKGIYTEVNNNQCKEYLADQSICCCSLDKSVTTKPKYILILSVTAFFAILTALVFFYKKNE